MSKTDLMPPKTLAENAPRMLASVPDLPFAITSFGAARIGHSAYVFGGQMGEAHAYARSWQNGKLLRLDTNSPNPEWTVISERDGAQGLALVAFNERLYRIGGFEARNEEGEENDLHSLDVFESYDPSTGNWQTLPSLPAPRSSFDACVVDGRIYVVGGWTMRGSEPTIGCDTALVYDLNEQHAQWRELPVPPFKRRALSVAASNGRLYAIGGIGDDGKTSSAVDQFVITENKWLPGMSLPECGDLKGFGSCSFVVDNSVVVSVSDGKFLRFDVYNNQWVTLKQKLDPGRFFHRILPVSNSAILAISGANMEIGKFSDSVIVNLGEKN
jgi:N-acetylneuraminic acid mutarotase